MSKTFETICIGDIIYVVNSEHQIPSISHHLIDSIRSFGNGIMFTYRDGNVNKNNIIYQNNITRNCESNLFLDFDCARKYLVKACNDKIVMLKIIINNNK